MKKYSLCCKRKKGCIFFLFLYLLRCLLCCNEKILMSCISKFLLSFMLMIQHQSKNHTSFFAFCITVLLMKIIKRKQAHTHLMFHFRYCVNQKGERITVIGIIFSVLKALLAENQPHRDFNVAQLRDIDALDKILFMCKVRVKNCQSTCITCQSMY